MSHPLPPKPSTATTAGAAVAAPSPRPASSTTPTLISATIHPNATTLLSSIALPPNPVAVCRAWTGPDDGIDAARKHIVDVTAGAPDVASALAALVRPEAELSLWVFAIVSGDAIAPRLAALDFHPHGLKEMTPVLARLDLAHLYPCSAQCDHSPTPCAECTKPRTQTICPLARAAPRISRPVRRPLRRLYSYWLAALRSLVLDQLSHPRLMPTKTGVLVCPTDNPTGEWGKSWLDPSRTLTHAHVRISLAHPLPRPSTPNQILVHLLPQSTSLVPFPSAAYPSPGTSVLLLPSSVPAYALAPYTGPAPHGFLSFLAGRGVQPSSATSPCILIWLPLPPNGASNTALSPANINALPTPSAATPAAATTVGARGMYVVWPRALCVVDTGTPPIDVTRLPNLPTHLMSIGSTIPVPTKPRRFPNKKPVIPRPIPLAQPPPATSKSTSLATLANSASTLIDTIVRAREKEKEKQRARLERARSGSAVPIPTLSGASTPTTSSMTVPAPPAPLHIQTQTPTGSTLYPSPLGTTPHHLSPVQPTHAHTAPMSASVTMSPALGIDMDLFGDPEGLPPDFASGFGNEALGVGGGESFNFTAAGAFGPATGYDTTTTSTLAVGSSGASGVSTTMDLFGDMWEPDGGVEPKSGQEDDNAALGEDGSDFFNAWPGQSVPMNAALPDFTNLDLDLDLDLDMPPAQDATEVIDLDPSSPASTTSAPTPIPKPKAKPYFPLTPPCEKASEDSVKKRGLFDPLQFTHKFEGVDAKYKALDGKFVFRLGLGTPRSQAKVQLPLSRQIQLPSQAWTYTPTTQNAPPLRLQFQTQLPTPIPSPNSLRRLRAGYIGLTNPSAKRMRSLRQVHKKADHIPQSSALSVFAKDWEHTRPSSPCATLSDADSDGDSDSSDDGMSVAITVGGTAPSRGTSPPLSAITSNGSGTGVPPGPGLILAYFRASVLGSGALGEVLPWPEFKDKEPKTPGPGPLSVPTPVSPGEMIAEPTKASIEATANMLAREAVDNWTWGAEVGAYACSEVYAPSRAELVLLGACLNGVGTVMNLQRLIAAPKIEVVTEVLTDRPYQHTPRFEKLKHPKLAVGHSGQVSLMSPFALRFWETIGLEPVGGPKDVTAFAIFEGGADSEEEDGMVERWLENVRRIYESRKLGKHTLGEIAGVKKGLVHVRWDTANKTLSSLAGLLPPTTTNVAFYIILPSSTLSAARIQPLLTKLRSDLQPHSAERFQHIVVHLVPSSTVFYHTSAPLDSRKQLENTAVSLYERIPRIVGRRVRRQIIPLSFPTHTTVHVPAFTIGRSLTPRFRFSMDWPDKQRETMDRHMFLHVAYGFSKSRRWLCAVCLDERGEAYETKVWRVVGVPEEEEKADLDEEPVHRDSRMDKYVNMVWHFANKFARRAGIEWRVVVCRMGVMGVRELEAWNKCTSEALQQLRVGIHISVLNFDPAPGLTIASGVPLMVKAPTVPVATPIPTAYDMDANDFFILPGFDTDIPTSPLLDLHSDYPSCGLLPLATAHLLHLTDPPMIRPMGKGPDLKWEDIPVLSLSSQLHLLLVATSRNSSLWKAGGDPWRELLHNFYSLTVLTKARMPLLERLPFHLAMLTAITNVVDNRDLVPADSLSDS